MSPEDRALVEQTLALAQENNKILRRMRNGARIDRAMRALYWILIIGLSVGAFYFIQPYIDAISGASDSVKTSFGGNVQNVHSVLDLLKEYQQ